MKRSALVLGLVTALLVPASIAVAHSDDAPVAEQTRLGDGNPEDCPYYEENGDARMLRLHEGEGRQNGPGWGRARKAHLIGPDTDRASATVIAEAKDPLDRVQTMLPTVPSESRMASGLPTDPEKVETVPDLRMAKARFMMVQAMVPAVSSATDKAAAVPVTAKAAWGRQWTGRQRLNIPNPPPEPLRRLPAERFGRERANSTYSLG